MRWNSFNRAAIAALSAETIYILWLLQHTIGWPGIIYFLLELSLFLLFALFLFNHSARKYILIGGSYSFRPYVDIFIPTVNEPKSLVRKTVQAALAIPYPNKTVYLLDDGNRSSFRQLADELGCIYTHRPNTVEKHYKAANLNYGLTQSRGTFILTIDADHVVRPEILDDLLGHFKDPLVAVVATRQGFTIPLGNFNHDHTFYEYMQSGKNSNNSAISCGSGAVYRRTALETIGGFQEWNLVEDLYTSFVLHQHGFRSIYSGQRYSKGHAPEDLPTICKQRWVWAYDTLRMFFWRMPLCARSLTPRQRLHYFEIGYGYLVSALTVPGLVLFNTYIVVQNVDIITNWPIFLALKVLSFLLILRFYAMLDQGTQSSRMWAALFLVYAAAALRALWYPKPTYHPTPKHRSKKPPWLFALPHLSILTLLSGSLLFHVYYYGTTILLGIHLFWFAVLIYWFSPVLSLGFRRT
ncbi:MAG: glycosyltransferase [Candidatus Doudnabacteria bacterium]|nr:glycosyltransferase [Candidatus Doudnabacteria bacterium]